MRRGLAVRLILSLLFGPFAAGVVAQSQPEPQAIAAPAATQAVVPALPAANPAAPAAPVSPVRASAPPFDPRYESSSQHQHGVLDDPASLAALPGHILRDQQRLWLAPLRIRSQHAPWLAATAGITAGLFAVDARVQRRLTYEEPGAGYAFANNFGRFSGGQMDLLVAGGFYVAGRLGDSVRTQETGVLGLRAVIDVMILNKSMKMIARRRRPALDNGTPNHGATGEFFESGRSFPSGHSAEAWALATIVAHQYRHRKWVPPLAYSLAGFVAFARVPARKHFPSDVFVGSVMGFTAGRSVWRSAHPERGEPHSLQILPYAPQGGGFGVALGLGF